MTTPASCQHRLWLASASPRRRALLDSIGVTPERIVAADIDESVIPGEEARAYVARMAHEKALAVMPKRASEGADELWILGADTAIVHEGEIFGKPRDYAHFTAICNRLQGQCHQVMSAICLAGPGGHCLQVTVVTDVWLESLSDAQRKAYWASGEPRDKAGGYAIQGLGSVFVERIEGSYSAVVGLPLHETARLLAQVGIPVWQDCAQ